METRAPSKAKLATMALFALSCVGLLLFLWLSFGGSLPLAAQGYRVKAVFQYADQLASQSDVRISGVSVGKVVATQLAPNGKGVLATMQINGQYAPLRRDTRAILRTKTILGETYIELTPGSPHSPFLKDGATLAPGQVQAAVQLDQIFNTFNGPTRRAFEQWQQDFAQAIQGNGQALNDVLGNLPSFAANASDILTVLDVQQAAVEDLVRNGDTVFTAIDKDPAALQRLITTGDETFATTAAQSRALAAVFKDIPTFEQQSKLTLADLQTFSENTDPLIRELEPVAEQLKPTAQSLKELAPSLKTFFVKLGPLVTASKTGLPAITKVLNGATPLLSSLGPFLENLNPVLGWLSEHQQLLSDFISNGASALAGQTTAFGGGGSGHYLRQLSPEGAETVGFSATPSSDQRGNAYPNPLWLDQAENFIQGNFGSWSCANTGAAGDGSEPADMTPGAGHEACWVAPTLPGATAGKIPELTQAMYSSK
jgi:phospholipid/cholesterol/gamma-HCH transport system substrate-binding protein